jgi:hypothetical protein
MFEIAFPQRDLGGLPSKNIVFGVKIVLAIFSIFQKKMLENCSEYWKIPVLQSLSAFNRVVIEILV